MDFPDLLDLIFTGEEELRNLGTAGGPEARALAEEAVAATRAAKEEAERAFARIFERAGLAKKADVEALSAKVDRLAAAVEDLARKAAISHTP
ncbi:MAG: hypothetical protein HYY18_04060 [Planctomycetes bacterium]|nr:hypothetical protein [Planctomycetota bacterium]